MDFDEREPSPEPQPYEDLDDDLGDGGDWTRDRSPTPVHGAGGGAGSSSKPRKRLLKKGGGGGGMPGDDGLDDFGLEDEDADPAAEARKRKGSSALRDLARGGAGKEKKEKKRRREDDGRGRDSGMARDRRGAGGRDSGAREDQDDGEREIQELWDTIAGGDSEVIIMTVCYMFQYIQFLFQF